MLRKKPILIPKDVEIKIENNFLKVKGPKGEITKEIPRGIHCQIKDNKLFVVFEDSLKVISKKMKALLGLYHKIFENDITGVISGFEKKLEIHGIGFRAQTEDNGDLILNMGFSHPVRIKKKKEMDFSVTKNIIIVSGFEKEKVGNVAAFIRNIKPPEPYKGKGIRYYGEKIYKKEGKKAATVAGA